MIIILIFIFLHFPVKCVSQDGSQKYENSSELRFCSFFNNRAPQPRPTLTNCTWFQKNSCCLQHEIDVSFSRVKPLIGATQDCQKYTNYLMCYICAPNQNEFYKKELLTVCESFCDLLYEFCKFAILKGNQIKQLYGSGKDFCLSRRFLVGQDNNCFSVPNIPKPQSNEGNEFEFSVRLYFVVFLVFISSNLNDFGFWDLKRNKKSQSIKNFSLTKVLFFVFLLDVECCQGHIIPIEEINDLGKSVSSFITEFAQNSVKFPHFEEAITSHSMIKVNDSLLMDEIKIKLSNFFTNRKTTIREMAKKVGDFHERFANNEVVGDSKDKLVITQIFDEEKIQSPKLRKTKVGFLRMDDKDKFSWFRDESLIQSDSYAERTFFASREGELFVQPNHSFKQFEPRIQPWYLGVKEAPSNVILIIDSSYAHNSNRFKRTRDAALLLLESLAQHQRIAVISSSSLTWNSSGNVHNASATVLGCVKERLVRATSGNVRMFSEVVRNVEPLGGSDHSGAFFKAFSLLKQQQSSHPKFLECRSVILFVTDGEQDEHLRCSPGYYQYTEGNFRKYQQGEICQHDTNKLLENIQRLQRNLPGAKANIFTFLTSHARKADVSFCGKLACQNNGAFSRTYGDEDLFGQMSPFFDYIRNREYSYEPIVTGPYESKFDGRLVLTFSAPVVTRGSNSILGVVGMDVLFSTLENLLEEHHEYMYMMNLVDGSAIVHPLIKKTYEGSKEWNDVPMIDLEMEDSSHSKEFPEVVRKMMQRINTEVVVRTNASEGFEVEEGRALWKPVQSVRHLFANIPGTNFGFGIKAVVQNDQNRAYFLKMKKNVKPQGLKPEMQNYVHTLFGSSFIHLSADLNITENHVIYPGIPVSFQHSAIILTPPAFCQSSFLHLLSEEKLLEIQRYINVSNNQEDHLKEVNEDEEDEDGNNNDDDDDDYEDDKDTDVLDDISDDKCLITERARQDIIMSLPLEESWKEIRMVASSTKSLYVATINGIIRHFPGLHVPEGMIRHPLRYQWFVQAMLNPGRIVITSNKASFSGASNIVTISRVVDSSHKVVLAADILKDELLQKILHIINTNICCPPQNQSSSCTAKCYLVSDQGEIVMSLSDGLDRSRSKELHKQFPFIYKSLAKHKILVPMKSTELKKNCSSSKNLDEFPRACMAVKMEPHIKSINLERMGGTFGRSSDGSTAEEPCHRGMFFLASVYDTNLFLLAIIDYSDDKHSMTCARQIAKLQETLDLQMHPLCPNHENYYVSRTNSTTCPKKRFVSLYCRYSSASCLSRFAFALCMLFYFVMRWQIDRELMDYLFLIN